MNENIDAEKYVLLENFENRTNEKTREVDARESEVRRQVAQRGYRLMHRRHGQYWLLFDQPMTLPEIEAFIGNAPPQ